VTDISYIGVAAVAGVDFRGCSKGRSASSNIGDGSEAATLQVYEGGYSVMATGSRAASPRYPRLNWWLVALGR
jgi:hypothetical protein